MPWRQCFNTSFQISVLLNMLWQIGELNTFILKRQNAVLCLLFVFLRELHILPRQMNFLKYKMNIWNTSENVLTSYSWKLVYPWTFLCFCLHYSTINPFAYFTIWNTFPYSTAYSTEFLIKLFSNFCVNELHNIALNWLLILNNIQLI